MRSKLLLLLTACLASASEVPAQERVSGDPACEGCRIELTKIVRLGVTDGPGEIDGVPATARVDSRGRFYLIPWHGHEELILVYEADGSFVQRIGTVGGGPKEFQQVRAIEAVADTLYVYDSRNTRLTKLDPDYSVLSTHILPGRVHDLLHLKNGSMVVNSAARDHADSGLALHIYDVEFQLVRSFAEHSKWPGDITSHLQFLVPAENGFWSINANQVYRLQRYDQDGNRSEEVVVDADWFPPYSGPPRGAPGPGEPTSARVLGAWESDNLIWVVGRGPDSRWKDGVGPLKEDPGHNYKYYEVTDVAKVYDSVIDVIDPTTGAVVARHTEDYPLFNVALGDGFIGAVDRDDLGFFYLDVYRADLLRE